MDQIEHLSATQISGRHYLAVEADARFTALRRSKAASRPLSEGDANPESILTYWNIGRKMKKKLYK